MLLKGFYIKHIAIAIPFFQTPFDKYACVACHFRLFHPLLLLSYKFSPDFFPKQNFVRFVHYVICAFIGFLLLFNRIAFIVLLMIHVFVEIDRIQIILQFLHTHTKHI